MTGEARASNQIGLRPLKVTIKITPDQLRAASETVRHAGEAADKLAADAASLASDMRKAQAPLRTWAVASWAALLDRILGR